MQLSGIAPDFEPRGSLSLKTWMANGQGLSLPGEIANPTVEAIPPYNEQIEILKRQIGAIIPRQSMKDSSGATVMDPSTQVTSVHGYPVLDLALAPVEANFALPLVHETAGKNDLALLNIAVAAETNLVGDAALAAAEAARAAGNSPNTIMAAAAAIIGPRRVERTLACTRALIDLFAGSALKEGHHVDFDSSSIRVDAATRALFMARDDEA